MVGHGRRSRFGLRWAALCAALAVAAPAGALADPTETVLHSFTGGSDGAFSNHGLVMDASGALYGTTDEGGGSSNCPDPTYPGCGTVFKLTPPASGSGPWTETVLYNFNGGSDGRAPNGPLIFDGSGALYGTTAQGGSSNCPYGCGTVFKLTPPPGGGTPWIETALYSFTGGSDGNLPYGGLIFGADGALYGTTDNGGIVSACQGYGCGTVFKLTPPAGGGTNWTKTLLYNFKGGYVNGPDGAFPQQALIFDGSGALYSTTSLGGAGVGTVFKLTPPPGGGTPWIETILHSFSFAANAVDGNFPYGGLIFDPSGALYGTTEAGGSLPSCSPECNGTVYKLTPPPSGGAPWSETTLYTFWRLGSAGGTPFGTLIFDADGALYGTTGGGGSLPSCSPECNGTVYKLTPPPSGGAPWSETTLYTFTGGSDGGGPLAGVIADSNGNLYGTTAYGGGSGYGTVFELTGTGFAMAVPFAGFKAALAIEFGTMPNTDAFELFSEFTLGQKSNGIYPPAEPVTLSVGTFTTTIPAGSFKGTGFGPFYFIGPVNGVNLEALIAPTGAKRFSFAAAVQKVSLTGTANPVPVTLTIGDDSGTTTVNAAIFGPVAANH
jgi:uncharacterized repeat protein (TIGR03803 family)